MKTRKSNYRKALVVGTIRNGSANVVSDLLRILEALNPLVPALAFVVESDSEDETVKLLEDLAQRDSRVRFASLGAVATEIPDRIARLRHCRNAYVHEIRQNEEYQDCDLIVVADLDGINTKIDTTGFDIALNSDFAWDGLAANQSARYYDLAALRHPLWSPNNFYVEANWLLPYIGKRAAWRHSMSDRMIRIPSHVPPILVESAFGGLCIYQRWVFEKCDYSGEDLLYPDEIDHVTLNRKMRSHGGNIYIHPALINANWTVHSLDGTPMIRSLKWLAHQLPFRVVLPILRKFLLIAARKK